MSSSNKDPAWFLINVIMSTDAKKLDRIDWDKVAEKMDIKTKGAAVKRYERLLGTYGLTTSYVPKAGVKSPGPGRGHGRDKGNAASPSSPTKKRGGSKRPSASLDDDDDADDDDASAPLDHYASSE